MIENLKTIYNGSDTIIKNKEYFSTKAYIEPFVEKLKEYTEKFMCLVKPADQISYNKENIDYVYNRVMVMGVFPEKYDISIDKTHLYHRVVCMAYALDVKTPICKFYTGVIDSDLNFYAFGGNCINVQKLEASTPIDYTPLKNVIDNGLNDNCEYILKQNITRTIPKDKIAEFLGQWIDFCIKKEYINDSGKIKLSSTVPIEAYKSLTVNQESDYFSSDDVLFYPNIMRSFLTQITEDGKDIINRYEKTQLINNLLKL